MIREKEVCFVKKPYELVDEEVKFPQKSKKKILRTKKKLFSTCRESFLEIKSKKKKILKTHFKSKHRELMKLSAREQHQRFGQLSHFQKDYGDDPC